jgi:hypothetical protein
MTTITDVNIAQTLDLSQIELILPEFTQSIVEYPTQDDFPQTGRPQRMYVDLSSGAPYRWSNDHYVPLIQTIDCGNF